MPFFAELKRRNVFKVGVAYAIVAWLIAQIIAVIHTPLHLPDWFDTVVIVLLGIGFPIALLLAWAFELTPEGIKPTPSIASAESIAHESGKKFNYTIIGLLVLVIVFLVVDNYMLVGRGNEEQGVKSGEKVAQTKPVVATTPSIAVLPFQDFSPKHDQEYFADGVTEEILNSLARVNGLEVTARTSSFYFKGRNEDLRTIGETLSVANILEGSVRKDGDNVRITAQLNNANTGYHLWSGTYDRKLNDIFEVQEDIAEKVAQALEITLGVGKIGRQPGMTRNVDAYDIYLQAKTVPNNLRTDQGIPRAIELYQRAIALDPSFAQAWLGLAGAYHSGSLLLQGKAEDWPQKASEALARARDLAPDSPQVLIAEARVSMRQMKWRKADTFFFQELPGLLKKYGDTNLALLPTGGFLLNIGRIKEAIDTLERARSADPLNPNISYQLGLAYMDNGDLQAALAEFDRGMQHTKANIFRGTALAVALASHDRQEIDKRVTALSPASGSSDKDSNNTMVSYLDNPSAAPAEIRRRAAGMSAAANPIGYGVLMLWAGYYHDPKLQLEMLRQSVGTLTQTGILGAGVWQPLFADVRKLPGFKDMMRKTGLVDYWRATGKWADFCHPVGDDDFECN